MKTNSPETTPIKQETFANKSRKLVMSLEPSGLYQNLVNQDGLSHSEAISRSAELISANEKIKISEADRAILGSFSLLGRFIDASQKLEEMKEHGERSGLSGDDKQYIRRLKQDHVIPFNHSLKEVINTSPNTSIDEASAIFAQLYGEYYSDEDNLHPGGKYKQKPEHAIISNPDAMHKVKESLNGMRHEIAAESLLTAAGLEFEWRISAEDDAKGIDLLVFINGKWTPIDIKASEMAAQFSLNKGYGNHPVATGLNPIDFTGMSGKERNALGISYGTAEAKQETFVRNIYLTVEKVRKMGVAKKVARGMSQAALQNA